MDENPAVIQSLFVRPMADLDRVSINAIRMLSIDAVQQANSGHPGMPMGAATMAYVASSSGSRSPRRRTSRFTETFRPSAMRLHSHDGKAPD
jgi:hypothetical protein